MLRPLFILLFCFSLLFLTIPIHAATPVLLADTTRIGNPTPASDAKFGNGVAGVSDLNGDGIPDMVIGAPGADKVYVISGKDQSVIRPIGDPDGLSKYQFGFSVVSVGDWDGDGVDDFAVGAPGQIGVVLLPCLQPPCKPDPQWGRAFVFSAASGALLKKFEPPEETLQFGYDMALLGDINGDGKPDLAVGSPVLTNFVGRVYALSGADGSQIWKAEEGGAGASTKQPIASFGARLAAVHDINGDGKADLVVGAPFHDDGTGKLAGAVYVLSGKDGTQIRAHMPPAILTDNRFGVSVTNIGDQNGDGKDDYMVGDSKASKTYLFSGADGASLGSMASKQLNDGFGLSATTVSDYDGDGKPDFWVSAPDGDRIYLMNAAGMELLHVAAPIASSGFGNALRTTKDLGGDKGLDVLAGAPDEVSNSGAAYLVTVHENKPPVADAGPDQTIECDRSGTVTLDGSASYDPDKDPITYSWKQISGLSVTLAVQGAKAHFTPAPPGVYEFQLTVTDDKSASSTDNVVITIRDTIAPKVLVTLTPGSLWPPNHRMVDITANPTVADACDPNPMVKLLAITSSEPVNSTGDGNTSPDIAGAAYGTDDRTFQLRAERKGNGNGRIYTAVYSAQDASGNTGQGNGIVTVAHNMAEVSQSSMSFSSTPVGMTSSSQMLSVSNAGPDPLSVSSVAISGFNSSDFLLSQNCTPTISAESACSINVSFKPAGTGNRMASVTITSNADNSPQTVVLMGAAIAAQDYTVEASPNSATIKQGQSATIKLTVSPISGFNQSVSFTCAGLPSGAGCAFSPASITPNGGPATTTLTVTTTAPTVRAGMRSPGSNWLWTQCGMFAAALLLIPGASREKPRRNRWVITLVLLVLCVAMACGGGNNASSSGTTVTSGTNIGTPPGTSQVTVTTGTSSTTGQHAVNVTITVTQ